jgi:hypothetical protein
LSATCQLGKTLQLDVTLMITDGHYLPARNSKITPFERLITVIELTASID